MSVAVITENKSMKLCKETIEILNEIIWENVEALFEYDSVEDELTWYATQEIGDYLQSVGSK